VPARARVRGVRALRGLRPATRGCAGRGGAERRQRRNRNGALFYNECISVRQTFGRYDPATRRLAPDSVGRQLYVVKVFEYNVDIYGLSTSRGVTDTVVLAPSHSRAPGASLEFASQLTRPTNTVLPTRASLRYSYNLARQRLLVREQRSASGAPGVAVEFELLPFEALDSVMAQPRVY
jgi:hypothetical protein